MLTKQHMLGWTQTHWHSVPTCVFYFSVTALISYSFVPSQLGHLQCLSVIRSNPQRGEDSLYCTRRLCESGHENAVMLNLIIRGFIISLDILPLSRFDKNWQVVLLNECYCLFIMPATVNDHTYPSMLRLGLLAQTQTLSEHSRGLRIYVHPLLPNALQGVWMHGHLQGHSLVSSKLISSHPIYHQMMVFHWQSLMNHMTLMVYSERSWGDQDTSFILKTIESSTSG